LALANFFIRQLSFKVCLSNISPKKSIIKR
jgi:hypothetical protein